MQITIHVEDSDLADQNKLALLHQLFGGEPAAIARTDVNDVNKLPVPTPVVAAQPEPQEEPAEPEANDAVTLDDAVAIATKLVSTGEAAKVKSVLTDLGAKKVSELTEEQIPAFVAALS